MDWDQLEEVFDEELWKLIDSLIERGLDTDQATSILEGFGNLTFDGYSFFTVYEEYQDGRDKKDYRLQMKKPMQLLIHKYGDKTYKIIGSRIK